MYPNPVTNYLTINTTGQILKLNFMDITGKIVKTLEVNSNEVTADISNLSSGIYFVKVEDEFGTKYSKLIKN
jgi:hypothetical protein